MEHKKLNRLVAGFVFLVSLVVYIKTLSDTVVFWDVGEFIAATYLLQVPHPPGSPLFLIIAKVFSFLPTAHDRGGSGSSRVAVRKRDHRCTLVSLHRQTHSSLERKAVRRVRQSCAVRVRRHRRALAELQPVHSGSTLKKPKCTA